MVEIDVHMEGAGVGQGPGSNALLGGRRRERPFEHAEQWSNAGLNEARKSIEGDSTG